MSQSQGRPLALITGASSGIGAVYADRFAAWGHNLVLVARDRSRLDTLAGELARAHGVTAEVLVADLTDPVDLQVVEGRLAAGDISVLVNNAGMLGGRTLLEADPETLGLLVRLNVTAVTQLAAAAARAIAVRGSGAIINLSSGLALAPERSEPAYSGSKAYVLSFTQALAVELEGRGVQLQVVLPGATSTEIFERAGRSLSDIPPERVMSVADLVDSAMTGFDRGELVTIPSLPDVADWEAFTAVRLWLGRNLSRSQPAARYRNPLDAPGQTTVAGALRRLLDSLSA